MEVYYKGIKSNRKPQKGYILSESLSSLKITRLFSTSFPGSLGKTLVSAGHVPRPKLIARGGVVKVSNYKQLKT